MYYGAPVTNTDRRHLERALALAAQSTCRTKHGVVIAHGPRVLAVAVNSDRNPPPVCSDPKSEAAYHAEINGLKQLGPDVDMRKLTLYSARIGAAGEARMAKPCPSCQRTLDRLGLETVVWTQ